MWNEWNGEFDGNKKKRKEKIKKEMLESVAHVYSFKTKLNAYHSCKLIDIK